MALKTLMASLALAGVVSIVPATAAQLTVGFSQIGSESGWRAAETTVSKSEATKRGVNLKIADAQQKQENQIKAIRSFIAQRVDVIGVSPVVETGWDTVFAEVKQAVVAKAVALLGSAGWELVGNGPALAWQTDPNHPDAAVAPALYFKRFKK